LGPENNRDRSIARKREKDVTEEKWKNEPAGEIIARCKKKDWWWV